MEQKQHENEQAQATLFRQLKEWEHRQESLKLAWLEQKMEQAQVIYQQASDEHEAWQKDFIQNDCRLQNLLIARLENGIREKVEEIQLYTHQLENLAVKQDVQELKGRLL